LIVQHRLSMHMSATCLPVITASEEQSREAMIQHDA
jgi:hypothetical protein